MMTRQLLFGTAAALVLATTATTQAADLALVPQAGSECAQPGDTITVDMILTVDLADPAAIGYQTFLLYDDSVLTNEGGPDPFNPTQPLLPIVQPSFDLWNAWVSWLSGDGKWRFTVNGKNLTDEEYLTNGYNIPTLGVLLGSFGQPRTVTATLEYKLF